MEARVQTPWGDAYMQEREQAPLYNFEKRGQTLIGVLVKMEPFQFKSGQKTIAYFFMTNKQGGICKIHGTWDINQKLRPDDIGRVVQIKFESEDATKGTKENPLRIFSVHVDTKLPKQDDLVITDGDITF